MCQLPTLKMSGVALETCQETNEENRFPIRRQSKNVGQVQVVLMGPLRVTEQCLKNLFQVLTSKKKGTGNVSLPF
jgi:hypothetical protein